MIEFTKKVIEHKYETEIKYYAISRNRSTEKKERNYRELDSDNLDSNICESISRTKRKIKEYARNNDFDYFVTLTFDPKKFNSFSIDTVLKCTRLFLQKLRRSTPDLKYLLVPEYHADKQKIHLHGYIKGYLKLLKAENPDKNGEILTYKGKTIYNLPQWNYGYSTALKIGKTATDTLKCSSYITKYVTKDLLVAFNQKRYWSSKNLELGQTLVEQKIYARDLNDLLENEKQVNPIGFDNTFKNDYYACFTRQDTFE